MEDIKLIIIRFLEGNIEEEDSRFLKKWLDESSLNRKVFEEFKSAWIKTGIINEYSKEEALQKIEKSINKRKFYNQQIAASIMIILLFSIFYYYYPTKNSLNLLHINPGKNEAILITNKGDRIILDSNKRNLKDMSILKAIEIPKDSNNHKIKQTPTNKIITSRGTEFSFILSDGTKVFLNSESELKFPITFSKNTREVFLMGEAYFDVKTNPERPFIVNLNNTKIRVTGTKFNVRNYINNNVITTLEEGIVEVIIRKNGKSSILTPGEQAIINDENIVIKKVDIKDYISWKDGYFIYRDKTLGYIMREISRWYNFDYIFVDKDVSKYVLTAKIKKFDSPEQIFKILQETKKFIFRTNGKVIEILKNK